MASKKTKKVVKKPTKKTIVKKKTITKKTIKKSPIKKASQKAKKTVSKKTKKVIKNKKVNKNILIVAPEDKYFWVNNGSAVRDLVELRSILLNIDKEQFLYHVNGTKNDFAIWIEEVLCDKKCADSIKRTRTISATIKNIEKALLSYHY